MMGNLGLMFLWGPHLTQLLLFLFTLGFHALINIVLSFPLFRIPFCLGRLYFLLLTEKLHQEACPGDELGTDASSAVKKEETVLIMKDDGTACISPQLYAPVTQSRSQQTFECHSERRNTHPILNLRNGNNERRKRHLLKTWPPTWNIPLCDIE
uniref:Uncharacterized protein n=2 Tax=Macaca TaxID=9539 RepID=A0A2K5UGA0_MACFA